MCWASFIPAAARRGSCWGLCFVVAQSVCPVSGLPPLTGAAAWPITSLRRSPYRQRWGFCSIRRWLSACRRRVVLLMVQFPPFGGVRPRFKAVWCPKRRPPRQKPVKTGSCGRGGLRFGHTCVSRGVLFACEPLNVRVNPLMRTSTPQPARGRSRPRTSHRVNVRVKGPACRSSGQRASERACVRVGGPMRGCVGPGALAALLLDWNCGAVVASVLASGPVYWHP